MDLNKKRRVLADLQIGSAMLNEGLDLIDKSVKIIQEDYREEIAKGVNHDVVHRDAE